MLTRIKGYSLMVTAICMAVVSTPTQAWRIFGGGSRFAFGAHGGSAAWSHGSGYAHGAYGGAAVWSRPLLIQKSFV